MELKWSDYSIDFRHIKEESLLEKWTWLIGEDKTPILITSIGDLFYKDKEGSIYFLMLGTAEIEKVANSLKDFEKKLDDDDMVDDWFLPLLVNAIKEEGIKLNKNSLYGYKLLPILGGEYDPKNYELTDIEVHFNMCGQIHEEIKDLPDGTRIRLTDFE